MSPGLARGVHVYGGAQEDPNMELNVGAIYRFPTRAAMLAHTARYPGLAWEVLAQEDGNWVIQEATMLYLKSRPGDQGLN